MLMNNEELEGLSKLTGIDLELFKKALIYDAAEKAPTIEHARAAHTDAQQSDHAVDVALARWNKLALVAIREAATFEEVLAVYSNTPYDSEARQAATDKLLDLCVTFEQARCADQNTYCGPGRSPFQHKMEKLALEGLEAATTVEEVIAAHANCVVAGYAIGKALDLWNKLAAERAKKASNLTEAKAAYALTPSESLCFSRPYALGRWIRYCSTVAETKEAYDVAPEGSKEQRAALLRMCRFYKRECKTALRSAAPV